MPAPSTTWTPRDALAGSAATLRRTSVGLLARHDYDNSAYSFRTADWDLGADLTVSLVAGALRIENIPNTLRGLRYNALDSRATYFVQAVVQGETVASSNLQIGPAAHVTDDTDEDDHVSCRITMQRPTSDIVALQEHLDNVTSASTVRNVATRVVDTDYRVSVCVAGSAMSGYDHTGAISLATVASTLTSGRPGIVVLSGGASGGQAEVRRFFVMQDAAVRITGLPSGAKVQACNSDAVLASATADGSTATLRMDTVALPSANVLKVLDSANVELARLAPSDTSWGAGIWGNDVYEFTQDVWGVRSDATASWGARSAPSATTWSAV
jgi:hypothetical protein